MAEFHIGRDNWFLVIPAAILGLVALWTVNQMYRAGDIRRSIEVVTTYQVDGREPLGDYLEQREGPVNCGATLISRFYGTLDVSCTALETAATFTWRVHVGQKAFAPGDDATLGLMQEYAPDVFAESSGS